MKKFKHALLSLLSQYVGPMLIRLYSSTFRVHITNQQHAAPYLQETHDGIFSLWHGRMFPLIYQHRHKRIHILISKHKDGEYVNAIVKGIGYGTIRGSSTSGGGRALMEMIKKAGTGKNFAFTPDGPKGPSGKIKSGLIFFAQHAHLPIIPVGASAEKYFELRSWDNYLIPKPFSRIYLVYGTPLNIPKKLTSKERTHYTNQLETLMNNATAQADHLAGRQNTNL